MKKVRKLFAALLLLAALALAMRSLLLQFITIATNDPRVYQSILKSGLLWSALSIVADFAYLLLARKYWRLLALLPLLIRGWVWWGIARMWPFAFA